MGLELCSKCHRMHYSTDKCAAMKSTAARKDVQPLTGDAGKPGVGTPTGRLNSTARGRKPQLAGTQAPPVDTILPKRGRPKTITDMKAYKATKAKKYRAERRERERAAREGK